MALINKRKWLVGGVAPTPSEWTVQASLYGAGVPTPIKTDEWRDGVPLFGISTGTDIAITYLDGLGGSVDLHYNTGGADGFYVVGKDSALSSFAEVDVFALMKINTARTTGTYQITIRQVASLVDADLFQEIIDLADQTVIDLLAKEAALDGRLDAIEANNWATNARLADMAQNRIKGRVTASTGDPEDLTPDNVKTILAAGTSTTKVTNFNADKLDGADLQTDPKIAPTDTQVLSAEATKELLTDFRKDKEQVINGTFGLGDYGWTLSSGAKVREQGWVGKIANTDGSSTTILRSPLMTSVPGLTTGVSVQVKFLVKISSDFADSDNAASIQIQGLAADGVTQTQTAEATTTSTTYTQLTASFTAISTTASLRARGYTTAQTSGTAYYGFVEVHVAGVLVAYFDFTEPDWVIPIGASITYDPANAYMGNAMPGGSGRTLVSSEPTGTFGGEANQFNVPCVPGEVLSLTATAKALAVASLPGYFRVLFYTSAGTYISASGITFSVSDTNWTTRTASVIAPANAGKYTISWGITGTWTAPDGLWLVGSVSVKRLVSGAEVNGSEVTAKWRSDTLYAEGSMVNYLGSPFRPNATSMPAIGESPASHPAKWEAVGGGAGSVGNVFPDPAGAKGSAGWTTSNATVTTVAVGNTEFPTELKILFSGTGTADLAIPLPAALEGAEMELRYEGWVVDAGTTISVLQGGVALPYSGSIPTVTGKYESVGRFWAGTGDLTLRISGVAGDEIRMTQVYLGRREVVYGAAIGPWTPYTPTFQGFGTPTGVDFRWRRNGENVEINGKFTSGTSTSTEGQISLPSGLTVSANIPTIQLVGNAGRTSYTRVEAFSVVAQPGNAYFGMGVSSSLAIPAVAPAIGSNIVSSGNSLSIQASIPIAQWQGSGVVQLAEAGGALYLSNSESTVDIDSGTAKTFRGIEGAAILPWTTPISMEMLLDRDLMHDEVSIFEVRSKMTGNWVPANQAAIPSLYILRLMETYVNGSGSYYLRGFALSQVAARTFRMTINGAGPLSGTGSWNGGAVTTRSWANVIAAADGYDRWRVRIEKAGARQETPTVFARYEQTGAVNTASLKRIKYNVKIADTHFAGKVATVASGDDQVDSFSYIVPIAGVYMIEASAKNDGAGGQVAPAIRKNGNIIQRIALAFGSGTHIGHVSAVSQCAIGDVLDVYNNAASASNGDATQAVTITRMGA